MKKTHFDAMIERKWKGERRKEDGNIHDYNDRFSFPLLPSHFLLFFLFVSSTPLLSLSFPFVFFTFFSLYFK